MAALKSKVFPNIETTKATIHTVPDNIANSKVSEIIFANKTTEEVTYQMFVKKHDGTEVVVMPSSLLRANESHHISTSIFLNAGDSVAVLADTANSIDVMLSYVEL
jgi:hypothetical protein